MLSFEEDVRKIHQTNYRESQIFQIFICVSIGPSSLKCWPHGKISVERGLDLTLLLSASPEQKQKVIDHESLLKSHFVELRKLIDSRARSVRVLALSKQTEATMETFYQFVIQLLILLVSCQIMIGGGGDASGDCKFENLVQV